jgi:hypothetical protein
MPPKPTKKTEPYSNQLISRFFSSSSAAAMTTVGDS